MKKIFIPLSILATAGLLFLRHDTYIIKILFSVDGMVDKNQRTE